MLGDVLVDERGQVTGTRVLPSEDGRPTIEVSFQAMGQLLGTDATDMGTFVSAVREDGTLFGDGQGVAMTADGAVATWKGQGVGRFTGRGCAVSCRGSFTGSPRRITCAASMKWLESSSSRWTSTGRLAPRPGHGNSGPLI